MRVGDYEIEAEIGRGGMGRVFRARSPRGEVVALKVLVRAPSEDARKRFDCERRLLGPFDEGEGFVPLPSTSLGFGVSRSLPRGASRRSSVSATASAFQWRWPGTCGRSRGGARLRDDDGWRSPIVPEYTVEPSLPDPDTILHPASETTLRTRYNDMTRHVLVKSVQVDVRPSGDSELEVKVHLRSATEALTDPAIVRIFRTNDDLWAPLAEARFSASSDGDDAPPTVSACPPVEKGRVIYLALCFLKDKFRGQKVGETLYSCEDGVSRDWEANELHMLAVEDNRYVALAKRQFLPKYPEDIQHIFRKWRAENPDYNWVAEDAYEHYPEEFCFSELGAVEAYKVVA